MYKSLHHMLDTFSAYKEPQKQSCQAQSVFVFTDRAAFTSYHGVQMAGLWFPHLVLIILPCLCPEVVFSSVSFLAVVS